MTSRPNNEGILQFAFRVTGDFTSDLANAPLGESVRIQGPFGDFVIGNETENVIMIAGGIGITPFMSMIRTAAALKTNQQITLLYSCQTADDIPFVEELRNLEITNQNFRLRIFLSTMPEGSNQYNQGPISSEYLHKALGSHANSFSYYICGPSGMMTNLSKQLVDLGAYDDSIITESFATGNKTQTRFFGLTPMQTTYAAGIGVFAILAGGIAIKDVQHTLANTVIPTSTSSVTTSPSTPIDNSTPTPSTTTAMPDTTTTTPTTNTTTPTYQEPTSNYSNTYQSPRSSAS